MPIYDYNCENCGDFEAIRNIPDREMATCPTCNSICHSSGIQNVNEFLAKTKYTLPPMAKRHFGEDRRRPPTRKKWV